MISRANSPPVSAGEVRTDRLEFIAVATDRDAERHPAATELVQRGHLLGQQDWFAHRQHHDAGGKPQHRGLRRDVREGDQRLEIVWWV